MISWRITYLLGFVGIMVIFSLLAGFVSTKAKKERIARLSDSFKRKEKRKTPKGDHQDMSTVPNTATKTVRFIS